MRKKEVFKLHLKNTRKFVHLVWVFCTWRKYLKLEIQWKNFKLVYYK